jgi:hypothetical protein
MTDAYNGFAAAIKALQIPAAENAWTTRPDVPSYIVFGLEFETEGDTGDNAKVARTFEGSIDLFSTAKDGEGFPEIIEGILTDWFECGWTMNLKAWEPDTRIFHWEWVFDTEE